MSARDVLVIATKDTARDAKAIIPLLARDGLRATITLGEDDLSLFTNIPMAIIIWAPPAVAYSFFKQLRFHFSSNLTQFLIVLPSSEPVTFESDRAFPNEAYLRGNVSPNDVVLNLRQQLDAVVRVPSAEVKGQGSSAHDRGGRVIAVFSAKGGVGKTAVSTNLAVAIKDGRSAEVLLMDGDLQFGDVAVWLGLTPKAGIAELLASGGVADEMAIQSAVQEHESGVRVLLPPNDPAVAELIKPASIRSLIQTLRRMYDFVVIDTHTSYSEETLAMLDVADDILLVVTPEVSTLRNTQVFLRLCRSLDYSHKLVAVLNRANTGIRLDQLPEEIRKLVEVETASDGRTVVYSVNMGKPFVQQNKNLAVSQGITKLAAFFAGVPDAVDKGSWRKVVWPFNSRTAKRNGAAATSSSR